MFYVLSVNLDIRNFCSNRAAGNGHHASASQAHEVPGSRAGNTDFAQRGHARYVLLRHTDISVDTVSFVCFNVQCVAVWERMFQG